MAVNKVDLYVSQILEDLNNGFTWLKKDDLGYGNIQEKYGAKEQQINLIRKHPKLKDAETTITIFNVIDDTKDEEKTVTVAANKEGLNTLSTSVASSSISGSTKLTSRSSSSVESVMANDEKEYGSNTDDNGFSAFANL